jgi:predicted transposase YbfD/YdcC
LLLVSDGQGFAVGGGGCAAGDGRPEGAAAWAASAPARILHRLGAPSDGAGQPRRPDAATFSRDLLDKIPADDLKDAVISADQMHTRRAHAQKIEAAGAFFLFTIGDNQEKLFDAADALPWRAFAGEAWTVDRGHGRIDARTIKTLPPTEQIAPPLPTMPSPPSATPSPAPSGSFASRASPPSSAPAAGIPTGFPSSSSASPSSRRHPPDTAPRPGRD